MQEEMKKTIERFDFESRGLESVSQRVPDLRGSLNRLREPLQDAGQISIQLAGELKAQTTTVSAHLQSLSENVVRMDEDLRGMQSLRRDLDDMNRTARDAGAQMTRIQDTWPAIEAALRDLEQLNRRARDGEGRARAHADHAHRGHAHAGGSVRDPDMAVGNRADPWAICGSV